MSGSTHRSSAAIHEITQEVQETDGANLPAAAANLPAAAANLPAAAANLPAAAAAPQDMGTSNPRDSNHQKAKKLIQLVSKDLESVTEASVNIKEFDKRFGNKLNNASHELKSLKSSLEIMEQESSDDPIYDEVHDFMKRVRKLKTQIPFNIKANPNDKDGHVNIRLDGSSRGNKIDQQHTELSRIVAILFADDNFKLSSASKDFLLIFDGLDINLKLCLLCFSVFPENVIIRKRLMINWWLGEGFINPPSGDEKSVDELGSDYFDVLIQKGFIVPAHKKRTLRVNNCKMHPFVRSALILVAKEAKFFDFGLDAIPNDEYYSSLRACLTGNGLVNPELNLENLHKFHENLYKVHTLINLNEDILDFKPELFAKMKNLNVIYLGRWQASSKHHVEVDDSKILDGFKVMRHLKFLSLQGISRITALPASISNLHSLIILDLKACHNLEAIPKEIGSLESLTHLDMSECYLLSKMPKELSLLKSLIVLKGFVVGGSSEEKTTCTLEDLAKLPKLRKLGIYTNKESFPDEEDLIDFSKFEHLTKILITWGSNQAKNAEKSTAKVEVEGAEQRQETSEKITVKATNQNMRNRFSRSNAMPRVKAPGLPSGLEKLDLRCYPGKFSPHWLNPDNLQRLKKLYIRGGSISVLSHGEEWKDEEIQRGTKWEVKTLRLKYLSELRMDWREVQNLFPKLVYLEKLRCPKLTLFPCDIFGVWIGSKEAQGNCDKWHPEIALSKPTLI